MYSSINVMRKQDKKTLAVGEVEFEDIITDHVMPRPALTYTAPNNAKPKIIQINKKK